MQPSLEMACSMMLSNFRQPQRELLTTSLGTIVTWLANTKGTKGASLKLVVTASEARGKLATFCCSNEAGCLVHQLLDGPDRLEHQLQVSLAFCCFRRARRGIEHELLCAFREVSNSAQARQAARSCKRAKVVQVAGQYHGPCYYIPKPAADFPD